MKSKGVLSIIIIVSLSILALFNENALKNVFAEDTYGIISDKAPVVFYGEELKDSGIEYSYDIYTSLKEINTDTENIEYKLPTPIEVEGETIEDVSASNLDVFKSVYNSVQIALDAFIKDYPEIFWFDYSKTISKSIFSCTYDSSGDIQWYITKIRIVFEQDENFTESTYDLCSDVYSNGYEIIDSSSSESTYHKLKDFHDYLCKNITYSTDASYIRNIYGGLVDGNGVCEAYAESFKFLCDLSGIPCISIMGKAGMPEPKEYHLWNYCLMDDGKWYAVDVTWDDQPNIEPSIIYDHFLCGSDNVGNLTKVTLSQTHLNIGDFSATDIYSFTYPELSSEKYVYAPLITATSTPEPIATLTPEPTATPTPELTATPTPEPAATPTPEPTATPTPEPTATPTPEPTATPTPEPTATPTPEPTATLTPEPTVTQIPKLTATPVVTIQPSETVSMIYYPGDVNEDGNINAEDALNVLKHAAKIVIIEKQENLLAADVNKDGYIDSGDALDILKMAAGLIKQF